MTEVKIVYDQSRFFGEYDEEVFFRAMLDIDELSEIKRQGSDLVLCFTKGVSARSWKRAKQIIRRYGMDLPFDMRAREQFEEIKELGAALHETYKSEPWYSNTGLGAGCFYLYVKAGRHHEAPALTTFSGWPVHVCEMGEIVAG